MSGESVGSENPSDEPSEVPVKNAPVGASEAAVESAPASAASASAGAPTAAQPVVEPMTVEPKPVDLRIDQSAPRIDQSAPRIDQSAPRIDQSAPRIDQSAPRIGQSAPAGAVAPTGHAAAANDPLHQSSGGVSVGRVVDVTVDSVGEREVKVRLADGREGVIARGEFTAAVAGGDVIRAALLAREDPKGRVWLSYMWAQKLDGWTRVAEALASKSPLDGTVVKSVKGGFVVDIGVRAFLPSSQVEGASPASLVGSPVRVTVIEADQERDRVVVSVRDLQRRESRTAEDALFKSLSVGKRLDGTVRSIAEYGAVVDLDGASGLIPRRELSWGRVLDVGDVVQPGDRIRVQVVDFRRQKRRITLSLRQTAPDPLSTISEGDIITGAVTKVVEYGAFLRIGDTDLEGLVHVSELTEARCHDARELVIPGEELQARVMAIEPAKRRIGLSVKAAM